jgi:hypothetical protein
MRAYTNVPLTPEVETGAKSGAPSFQARVSQHKTHAAQLLNPPITRRLARWPQHQLQGYGNNGEEPRHFRRLAAPMIQGQVITKPQISDAIRT